MSEGKNRTHARRLAAALAAALTASMGLSSASTAAHEVDRAVREVERYCVASWKAAGIPQQEWDDCTQEAIVRLLERLAREGAIDDSEAHRELQRVVWSTAKAWQRSCGKHVTRDPNSAFADSDVEDRVLIRELLGSAIAQLGKIQREVITRWAEGHTVSEIAQQLGLPPARVSDAKYKAIQNLRRLLAPEQKE